MAGIASGWALLVGAGAANAAFSLPMKFVRRWRWENTWAVWSVSALVVLPVVLAVASVPSLAEVYSGPGLRTAAIVCLLGMGWGLAQVLFGQAIDAIGVGLAFSIVLGLSAACGTLLPLVNMQAGSVAPGLNNQIGLGLLLVAGGVAACALAGRRREAAQSAQVATPRAFAPGLLMAILSGVLAAFMNVGLTLDGRLLERASAQGIGAARGMYAVWLPLLLGGAVPNLLYCAFLLRRRRTSSLYRGAGQARNAALAVLMAVLWFSSTVLYGVAAQWMGKWGVVLGWPVFLSLVVIFAGIIGMATGEWTRCGKLPILYQAGGILLLVLAIVAFSRAQNILEHSAPEAPTCHARAYVR